uniref:Rab-GAP TBC domain-containing protein n=1 Tax=Noctiluca scintillans TaxID=2966 RepID=A0A7S1A3F4_NOCSC
MNDDSDLTQADLVGRALQLGESDGSDASLRFHCFRGIPDDCSLRPVVWKVLLGYLPMSRCAEWNAIQGEKRVLYASYRDELVEVTENTVRIRESGSLLGKAGNAPLQELLQEIRQDVDRTRKDLEFFQKPETTAALVALLFVYARLNPGVRYVQGMNEVAAIMLYVMSTEPAYEADAFWCFSELMVEIKEPFMEVFDNENEGITSQVGSVAQLLRSYDSVLAMHLQKHDLPPFMFVFRWCTMLFAQDASITHVVRLWDRLISDPRRYEFCTYMCLAVILATRDDLLCTDKQFAMAEVLQSAPRRPDVDFDSLLYHAMAICAFERRPQMPPFPPRAPSDMVDELSEWVQSAAAKASEVGQRVSMNASEVGLEVARNLQENVAPIVYERATQASVAALEARAAAAVVAAEKAQAAQAWFEETAPARQEAMEQAGAKLSSLWSSVRATSAIAVQRGQSLASEYVERETMEAASASLSSAASAAYQRAASLVKLPEVEPATPEPQ